MGGGHGVQPPAKHILPRPKVLGHHNKVLVEAVCKLILVDGPGVPPGAALRVGADGQVQLLLRLPFLAKVLFPDFSPVGLVLSKFENVPSKALLCEGTLAISWHLAQPVGVSSAMVDCYKANGHRATAGPLGELAWEHYVSVQGTAAKGPCARVVFIVGALGAWGPGVVVCRTAERVAAMDATPPS